MNIEECDPAEAIRRAGRQLINFHVADSNREAVGRGHTDFAAIVQALHQIGYNRSLAMEPLPPVPDPYIAARIKRYLSLRDVYAQESITRLKALEAEVART
jgi:sugar phosphate isomerase/epimerase